MAVGKGAGADGAVAGAGDGVQVGVAGVPEHGPAGQQRLQALRPLAAVLIEVVGAHLIDRDQHHQVGGRRRGRALGRGGGERGDN